MAKGSNTFGGTIKLEGEAEYRKALSNINSSLRVVASEMGKVTAEFGKNNKSTEGLTRSNEVLNKQINAQKEKIELLKGALEKASSAENVNQKTVDNWQISLNKAEAELSKMEQQLKTNNSALGQNQTQVKNSANSISGFASTLLRSVANNESFGKTFKKDLVENFNNSGLKQGIDNVKAGMDGFKTTIQDVKNGSTSLGDILKNKLNNVADKLSKSTKDNADKMDEFSNAEEEAGKSTLKLGELIKANLLTDVIKKGFTTLVDGAKKLGSTLLDVGKSAIQSYADYEQLIGGVETLFKDSSPIVENYANNAYKTAGLSANEYMETVTSFSASLLQSLNNDTGAVAKVSDMAITDMADNANKMGTSMSSIQTAYQGFAKQNYTMLDNLKLGYGGTKSEMERLLSDAQKITGIKYDINNLSDVYNAIHVIQGELGITGTTAKEASTTIQGSMASLKSAWQNVLTGIANDNADFGMLIQNLVDSLVTASDNIMPRVEVALNGVMELIIQVSQTILPKMVEIGINTITNLITGMQNNLPQVLESVKTIVSSLIAGLTQILPEVTKIATEIIMTLVTIIVQNLPQILECGIQMLVSLIEGIAETIPTLIPTIIDAIMTMIETILDNLDLVIDAGIELLLALTEGILDALPRLIDKVPVIIEKLVTALANNLPKILQAGITIIVKLAEGLIKAIPQLISKIPQIVNALVNGLKQGIGQMADVGKNLVQGLWNGINNAKNWVLDKIKGFGKSILNGLKSFFGIHSPSTVFRDEIGKYMAEGLGEGFTDEMDNVTEQMKNAVPDSMDIGMNVTPNILKGSSAGNVIETNEKTFSSESSLKEILEEVLKNFIGVVELDNEKVGKFVIKTVVEEVYT